jgi:hypothetical protein
MDSGSRTATNLMPEMIVRQESVIICKVWEKYFGRYFSPKMRTTADPVLNTRCCFRNLVNGSGY